MAFRRPHSWGKAGGRANLPVDKAVLPENVPPGTQLRYQGKHGIVVVCVLMRHVV
jgi:hypothetical protein